MTSQPTPPFTLTMASSTLFTIALVFVLLMVGSYAGPYDKKLPPAPPSCGGTCYRRRHLARKDCNGNDHCYIDWCRLGRRRFGWECRERPACPDICRRNRRAAKRDCKLGGRKRDDCVVSTCSENGVSGYACEPAMSGSYS